MSNAAAPAAPRARTCLAVMLAAGEGTRMKSARAKVLHEIAGRSMLAHALTALREAGATRVAVVVGPDREDVAEEARRFLPGAEIFTQAERLGTAHAALAAAAALKKTEDDVVVAFADTPLVEPATYERLRAPLAAGAAVAVLGFEAADPFGYGRLVSDKDGLAAIREERDASPEERRITLCNAGLMAIRGERALALLREVGNRNVKGEYYLTDVVGIARAAGERVVVVTAPEAEVMGINDRAQLAEAEAIVQARLRRRAMKAGVTLTAPETVFFSLDTEIGSDVVVEPHVVFGPGVRIESGAVVHAFSHLEGAHVARGASVGPFARLRPGAAIGAKARIGNFVEVKNAEIGPGAKANHLAYLGDATIGEGSNIGAGTITCNYDGFDKHRTEIGKGAFVGTNSSLVAPVSIGEGAYIGSGSVITDDVPADALALGRGRQAIKQGWAKAFRNAASARKMKAKAKDPVSS
ncbi:MAG TPA: bifunctional UDP-N-acetylglucosamine diphosphorylase/glucosamine-1-phosphate N-acetyltransferase GlmU [Beijerinckiaceae bacterium]|jgi:bifunctional UDP-N-acetylglucosamine pyrophosphorylase/glucosamine-1-phosphate N-acetyltransferase|nr:UDP-N-acetylglucosamine diphosphorylase/glucosamine-phosphate N-acetyltransferase [Microvirga sp.]HZB38425.1 bifunctional UDP-N-acetylglucosamine diphosphorylase/glucosamine-1-phosphate N-acetyltransferase GlmU [Beijerinckiaceae bacterium]